jgi:hypothetical protein
MSSSRQKRTPATLRHLDRSGEAAKWRDPLFVIVITQEWVPHPEQSEGWEITNASSEETKSSLDLRSERPKESNPTSAPQAQSPAQQAPQSPGRPVLW